MPAALRVGEVHIVALDDGGIAAPLATTFPETPAGAWTPYRARYPAAFRGDDWWIPFRAYLIRAPGRNVLVDAGVGDDEDVVRTWHVRGDITAALARAGLAPDDVAAAVITHAHFDHVAGAAARGRALFRRVLVHRADVDGMRARARDAPAFGRLLAAVEKVLEPIEGNESLGAEISVLHTPGHTPGSVSVLVASRGEQALIVGDAIHHPAHISEPGWRDRNDADHETASRTRRELVDRSEAPGMTLIPTHFPEPFGSIARDGSLRYWRAR